MADDDDDDGDDDNDDGDGDDDDDDDGDDEDGCLISDCKMSGWAAYIKNLLDSSQGIQRAAIVGYPDGSVWARSEGDREFRATDEELKKFVSLYDHIEKVPATGCDLEGVHYIVPRTEQNLIFGKRDKTGIFAAKTKSAVLIACYKGENAAEVRVAVEKLAQYLMDSGY
ncbi:Profilin-1 [Dirofilaria immitis]|nr:Profilin-1 [Dirofilaria immitis]